MYKLIAVYKQPAEDKKEAFDSHYQEVHTPLCFKVPGMKELRVNKIFGGPTGKSDLYMIAEMVFDGKDAFNAAAKTKEMMETGKDAMKFAGDIVSVHFASETVTKA